MFFKEITVLMAFTAFIVLVGIQPTNPSLAVSSRGFLGEHFGDLALPVDGWG